MGKRTNTAKWVESAGRWQINVQKDGIRKTFTSAKPGRTGQREANAKADAWLDEGLELRRKTLGQIFPEYLAELQERTGKSNWRPVESRWKIWMEPVIGRLKPDAIGDQHLQKIITKAYSNGGLSKKSLRNIRADLVAFIKYLRKNKLTSYRPEDIIIPQGATVGIRRILQPDDIVTLFSVDTSILRGKIVRDKYINAYRFQVLTGLRPGELAGLMPSDIVGDQVHLQRAINTEREITAGKNKNAIRAFSLTPTAKAVLKDQLSRMDGLYIFGISSDDNYRAHWKKYCEVNGVPYVSPYELRHTFVSMIQRLPEGWVKELVGHSRNMDTFGTYAHEVNGQQDKIAAGVEAVFQDILNAQEQDAK